LAVATEGFGVAFLDQEGHRTKYVPFPAPVRGLAVCGQRLVAIGDDGAACLLGLDGELHGLAALPGRPEHIVRDDDTTAAAACGAKVAVISAEGENDRPK
jgi:hypothetical protein